MIRLITLFISLLLIAPTINAHEVRPGFIDLIEQTNNNIKVTWKKPIRDGEPLGVTPTFSEDCEASSQPQTTIVGNSIISNWKINCSTNLQGQVISFPGLESTLTDIIVRYQPLNGDSQTLRAVPDSPFVTIAAIPNATDVVKTYTLLGIEHILNGIDHLLFVLALILFVNGKIPLIKAITAFTIAHSITLAASILGQITLAPRPVETVIALSIVFLANDLAHKHQQKTIIITENLTQRSPWIITFCFGLLHGFGFAGALSEIGLPSTEIPLALLMFNIGVELGQLAFVIVVLIALVALKRLILRQTIDHFASYAIGSISCFWLIQRVLL